MKKVKKPKATPKTEAQFQGQLEELFYLFRVVDDARTPEHLRNAIRFLVARVEEIQIRMDGDKNHGRGHVHIKYKTDGHAASYAIDDGSRLAGQLPRYYDHVVQTWIVKHQTDLRTLWESTQAGKRDETVLLKFQTIVYD